MAGLLFNLLGSGSIGNDPVCHRRRGVSASGTDVSKETRLQDGHRQRLHIDNRGDRSKQESKGLH